MEGEGEGDECMSRKRQESTVLLVWSSSSSSSQARHKRCDPGAYLLDPSRLTRS